MDKNPGQKKILFVGLNTVDLQFLVSSFPKPNTKTKAKNHLVCVGGPAYNAAISCAYLGAKVDLITPLGIHAFTDFITDDARKYGIEIIDPLAGKKSDPIFACIITSEENGERTIISYLPEYVNINTNLLNINYNDYQLVLFDGFYPRLFLEIANKTKLLNILTVLDAGSYKPYMNELLQYIDIAICSNDFMPPSCNTKSEVFDCMQNHGVSYTAITNGGNNILWSHKDETGEIPVEKISAVDTLAAGDILHGAFCYYFAQGRSFTSSLREASAIASLSCKSFGAREWMRS